MYIYIYIHTNTLLDAFMLQSAEPQGLRPLAWAKKDSEVLRRLQRSHTSETRKKHHF